MGKHHKKSRPSLTKVNHPNGPVEWSFKTTMNMSDLSRDDDFINHLLVEKLGTGKIPLYVHKMDPSRVLTKTDPDAILAIVHRVIAAKVAPHKAIKLAVDELLQLHGVRTFIKPFTQPEVDAFATHASRYFELYLPTGSIEISHTDRYSHHTGKSELCILATRYMPTGTVITELKGSMAKLTREDEKEMKRNTDIRRDFSVIHSGQMKKNHLFLGPARFVNHDCENNCELFREGKYITFRTLRPIRIGEEITAHYGDGYFGRKNRHCLCATCERRGRGGYAQKPPGTESLSASDSDSDSDTSSSGSEDEAELQEHAELNVNERRTRRGIYHIAQEGSDDSDEEDDHKNGDNDITVQPGPPDVVAKVEEKDISSDLSSLPSSRRSSHALPPQAGPSRLVITRVCGMMTPDTDTALSPTLQVPPLLTPNFEDSSRSTTPTTPYKSIISTRRQKAAAVGEDIINASAIKTTRTVRTKNQLVTPPPSVDTSSLPDDSSAFTVVEKRVTRSISSAQSTSNRSKGKGQATASNSKGKVKQEDHDEGCEEPEVTRVLRTRPSGPANTSFVGSPIKPEVYKDQNGKPLPTCITCYSILPIILVDKEIVWGVGKKKEFVECPRCMRHIAIYGHPWPARTAGQRALFLPTPREELTPVDASTRRVSSKVLPVLDRKLVAAAKNPLKRTRESPADQPSTKKIKTENGSKATVSTKAKDNRSTTGQSKSGHQVLPDTQAPETVVKRRPGRPRLSSLPRAVASPSASVNQSISAPVESQKFFSSSNLRHGSRPTKATVVQHQPRDGQGRFGKKDNTDGKHVRRQISSEDTNLRAHRALERDKTRSQLDGDVAGSDEESQADDEMQEEYHTEERAGVAVHLRSINGRERKRRKDDGFELADSPSKRYRPGVTESASMNSTLNSSSINRIADLRYHRPNPMTFSRSTWVSGAIRKRPTPMNLEVDSTAAEVSTSSASTVNSDPQESLNWRVNFGRYPGAVDGLEPSLPAVGALTINPSPVNFAKRRWSSESLPLNFVRDGSTDLSDGEEGTDDASGDLIVNYKERYAIYFTTHIESDASSDEEDVLIPEATEQYILSRQASFDDNRVAIAANA